METILADFFVALSTIAAAVIAVALSARYALQLHHTQALTALRVEIYQDYLKSVKGHAFSSADPNVTSPEQTQLDLFRANYDLQVAASDDVCRAANELIRTFLRSNGPVSGEDAEAAINQVIFEMRKELAGSKMSKKEWETMMVSIFSK